MPDDWSAWRSKARDLLDREVAPESVQLVPESDRQLGLFATSAKPSAASKLSSASRARVSKDLLPLLRRVLAHRAPERHPLAYRILWRVTHGEPHLVSDPADPDRARARELEQAVRRAAHKTKAFVRFKELDEGRAFVAFHRPEHRVLPLVGRFFVERFGSLPFSILTPDQSLHWTGSSVEWGPGASAADVPTEDALEDWWRTYYASTFNPARVKPQMMRSEMPKRYWDTLPEARLIPELIRDAPRREEQMQARAETSVRRWFPERPALSNLSSALSGCRGCPRRFEGRGCVIERSPRPIAGRGPEKPQLIVVGEQPGDTEDQLGRPFVGPAGEVLQDALRAAGHAPESVWLTNAVRCFHHRAVSESPLPKPPRLHESPNAGTIERCRPWLELELSLLPETAPVIALGATAAQALLGRRVPIRDARARTWPGLGERPVRVSYHPSAVLRARDPAAREATREALIDDLRRSR